MARKQNPEQSVADVIAQSPPAKIRRFGINRFEILGRVSQEPQLRYTPTGKAVVRLSVATTVAGHAEFHALVAWERNAEVLARYAVKGRELYVEGRISWRVRELEGHRVREVDLVVEAFQLLGRLAAASDGEQPARQGAA